MGNYPQAEIWFADLEKMIAASKYPDGNYHKPSAALGLAKLALTRKDWDAAAEHIKIALNIQIQMPIYFEDSFEDKY